MSNAASRHATLAMALCLATAPVAPAQAGCRIETPPFIVASGQTYRAGAVTDGAACEHLFWSGVTALSIVARPKHGRLTNSRGAGFRYQAAPQYRGKDGFTLRLCGKSQGVPGCSTLVFDVAVE